jgi:hypothetical protein
MQGGKKIKKSSAMTRHTVVEKLCSPKLISDGRCDGSVSSRKEWVQLGMDGMKRRARQYHLIGTFRAGEH